MTQQKGIFEEIKRENKAYPDQQVVLPLSPSDYLESLIHHTARQLEHRFRKLIREAKHVQMLDLVQKIGELVEKDAHEKLSLPLSKIMYRFDQQEFPVIYDQSLTKLQLIANESQTMNNFFKSLKFEMLTSDSVDFMVSFVRKSGVQLLIRPLQELERLGKRVRVLTSTYMNITEPEALKKLLGFSNVEVRVYQTEGESFHTKAYLFHRDSGLNSVIIGSSNLSHSALRNGYEWNVKIPSAGYLPIYDQAKQKFQQTWEDRKAIAIDEAWLNQYQMVFQQAKMKKKESEVLLQPKPIYLTDRSSPPVQPNGMQEQALKALKQSRWNGHKKGMIIAATGTGKTYLSAFDVFDVKPKRLLFIAHREELLDRAMETFSHVFGRDDLFGKLTGNEKQVHRPYLFSTIQTLSRDDTLYAFEKDEFDYIIVDEFHRAGADSYLKVLDYFSPHFLLGMTATPERADGKDVFRLVDYHVIYEIRLRDALEHDLLVPFHYFGLSDDTVNYEKVKRVHGLYDEEDLTRALSTNKRVDYILDMIRTYGYDGDRMIALGFCASVRHAEYMAEQFTQRGILAVSLTGKHSPEYRRKMVQRLEDEHDPLQIIFTVDIFNEGIDIPKCNLILFLRPTESPTVFMQQLGRGLRKTEGKEFVTILDFIGNCHKSFVIPLALSGQTNHRAFDRDSLRIAVQHEFADLPGGSYVDLEPIAQKEILKRIEQIKMDSNEMLKNLYEQFKKDLGRSPELIDFLYTENAPSVTFFIQKYGSWVKTKERMKDLSSFDEKLLQHPYGLEVVQRLEQMLPLKWPYEFILLEWAMEKGSITVEDVLSRLEKKFCLQLDKEKHMNRILRAMERCSQPYKKQSWSFGSVEHEVFNVDPSFVSWLQDEQVLEYVRERIDYGLIEYRRGYQPERSLGDGQPFILYQNYTRNDVLVLSGSKDKEGSWREGVSCVGDHYFLFVNLNKGESVAEHLKYKDYFIDPSHFHWQSQNQTSHESMRGKDYVLHKERGKHIHLFVRKFEKMHGLTLPFMYLGEVDYVSSHGDKPMNITWRLHHTIPEHIFIDLIR
ncbi:DUF3427 domain-containing protein [Staphylospora marina]|uniref:DUF3427 domain-containing protein n=1 Tax=Staphylospora marina TaxID=2490858 RepID=UPI000F5BD900|nr:DUF3427 domain-containing protein [Staphylospora marina]